MIRFAARFTAMCGLLSMVGCGVLSSSQSRTFVVFFTNESTALDPTAAKTVQDAAQIANDHANATIYVSGYSAVDTALPPNLALSARRARVVADALRAGGVDPGRITASGKGPVDYALDPVQARRVEIDVAP